VISPGAGWLHQLFIASASAFGILLKKHGPLLMRLLIDKTTELNDHGLKSRPVERALVW